MIYIYLLVTSIGKREEFFRFLESLNRQSVLDLDVNICVYFVNQCGHIKLDSYKNRHNNLHLTEVKTEGVISLSRARNMLLDLIRPRDDSIVGFSDDDCWYPRHFFKHLLLRKQRRLIMTNVFDPISMRRYGSRSFKSEKKLSMTSSLILGVSVNIFVDYECIKNISFNENFGVGEKYGSGEETIFLSQIVKIEKAQYEGSLMVYHRVDDLEFLNDDSYLQKIYDYSYGYSKACLYICKKYTCSSLFLLSRQIFLASMLALISRSNKKMYSRRLKGLIDGLF